MNTLAAAWRSHPLLPDVPLVGVIRRRVWWSVPLLAWNGGLLYLNTITHNPIVIAMGAASLGLACLVVATDPDEVDDTDD